MAMDRLARRTDALTPANITTFAYDDVNRTTTITDPEGKQTVIQYNTAGQPTSITDPLTLVTSFAYDTQGNLTTTTDALSNVTTRYYDAVSRLTALSDPRGVLTRFMYDNLNRVTQIQDALSGLTTFTYDPNGNLLSVTDAKNQTTTYTYDEMDRLLTRKDALNRTESYEYDKAGNLAKFTDRKNQSSTFAYDALNRRTSASYPDATVTFGYDAIGRLTSVSDSLGGNITWVYDTVSGGHHPRVQETTSAGTVTVEYDEIGRRFKLSATTQTDVTYTYDKNSRLKTVTQGSQTVTLAYDDAGRRTSLTYPNGVVTSYGYDNANRLQTMAHVKTPTTIESLTYQSDAAGNRISLTRANAAATLLPQAMTAEYDAANEQFKFNSSTPNLVYDGNGNLSSFTDGTGTTTYTWNARNQLVSITAPSLTASFVYDGLGWRTSKTINSVTTGYWYDGQDLLAELSGSTPTVTYVRSLNVDEPFIRQLTGGNEYYQTDALGSTVALSNAAGASVVSYSYEPFGKTTVTGTSSNPFQFTGRENDSTGLYYYRARYYSNTSMRFINEDPINFAGGDPNLYAYVSNNPVQWLDPYGLYKIFVCLDTNILTVVNDDGQGAYQTGTVTGCNETPTKSGRYRLGAWEDDKTSTKWGWKSSTPWSQWAVGANVFGPYFSAIMNGSGQGLHGSLGPMYNQPIFRWMQRFDCSHGCIRVSNQAINDIHNLIPKIAGTIIDIRAKCIF